MYLPLGHMNDSSTSSLFLHESSLFFSHICTIFLKWLIIHGQTGHTFTGVCLEVQEHGHARFRMLNF